MSVTETPDVSGKTALITGASGGIGGETARRLAKAGAKVAVHYNSNADSATKLVEEITAAGGTAIAVGGDVTDEADCKAIVETTISEFGGLDILVNNAGISSFIPFGEMTAEAIDKEFSVNVKSVILMTQAAAPYLENGGRVVNVSSNLVHAPIPGMTAYCAAKSAVACLTLGFAKELGEKGISVNAVSPGATHTPMTAWLPDDMVKSISDATPLSRLSMPDDIADVIVFLASPASRWVNGRSVVVDGGLV
ncbi:3-oxoacyl-ACP reductase family protein [Ponticaulis sp.]|uniref:SDR family NAD(P)-dependent oxidoreductase n=1 Tax=Ponticaulis sp. TaxID=2020902 RepID=UPI0026111D31|nr:3-oxoacyl-ACP reductase family protein [Ponticaulis sp.]MDF1679044.1 3-oxoacyl-ACP reductase FabG [Ponticaulis sp.]